MCISSNSVNQAQDLISVTKFEDFPNSLIPIVDTGTECGGVLPDIMTDYAQWRQGLIE